MGEIRPALREIVRTRAGGRCEYCGRREAIGFLSHQVDHIIAAKHGGLGDEENLALCCAICNVHKCSDISTIEGDELIALFHPRKQTWHEHFSFEGFLIVGLTATGRATVRLLRLNEPKRVQERADSLP